MAIVGIITARGGSKSIPRKNLAPCAGKPLIAYTCAAALGARRLERVILSTDDAEIAEAGRAHGVEVPFLRPPELANDTATHVEVMQHALNELERGGPSIEALVILQPTSPLRTSRHIDDAIDLFRHTGAASVVSVVEVPHQFHPWSLLRMDDNGTLSPAETARPVFRRQDKPRVWARNGPAIVVVRPDVVRAGQLYGEPTVAYPMTAQESVDVDGPEDLAYADWLLTRLSRS